MGLQRLLLQGVTDIYAIPGMLFAATHAKNDIPSVLTTFAQNNPGIRVHYGRELGLQTDMIEAFQTRIYETLEQNGRNPSSSLYDTLLVVVGRGTSDTHANAEVAKLTRLVSENMGFGWAETVYSGVTYPSVGVGLEMLMKLGYQHVVIAPYFLFTGRLIKRIQGYVNKVSEQYPTCNFIRVPYLSDHPGVMDAFTNRVTEIMEKRLAKQEDLLALFQQRLAAGEVEVHHHHAEYVEPGTLSPDHEQTHHHHVHHYYRHIAHPLGPRTMIGEGICCCFMKQFPDDILQEERDKIDKYGDGQALAHL